MPIAIPKPIPIPTPSLAAVRLDVSHTGKPRPICRADYCFVIVTFFSSIRSLGVSLSTSTF
jgi:hypothetical protein